MWIGLWLLMWILQGQPTVERWDDWFNALLLCLALEVFFTCVQAAHGHKE